jgi:uncharacterized protein (TIGR02145 family)
MRLTLTTLALLISAMLTAQAPALIPYQGAARNGAGQPLTNASLNARFTIHNQSVNGPSVWQEEQTVSTNNLGLFTAQLGNTTSLAAVNWANGSKFLQVELDLGNGYIEIGTQQMLSVPYALHAGSVRVHVSAAGDTLYVGDGSFVIVPGISEANNNGGGGTSGTTLHTCGATNIHNADLTYGTMTDQEGNEYKTIVIGTQEWMAENLKTSIYRNGDVIPTGLSSSQWNNTVQGAWSYFQNDASRNCPFGKLYNWYACVDARELCPTGWHVPTDADWTVLSDYLGGEAIAGGKMKTPGISDSATGLWSTPNFGATNSSGFSGIPGGYRLLQGPYSNLEFIGYYWSSSDFVTLSAYYRYLIYDDVDLTRATGDKRNGFSVRCLRD